MKNIVFILVALITLNAFAQTDDAYTKNVKKALELYKGSPSLDLIAKDAFAKVPQNKMSNPELQKALTNAKNNAYADAISRFKEHFTADEMAEIVKDLSVKKESYSGTTNNFTRQWGISQRKYITEINELYKKFQQ
ncbi:MAG: hypothetical protein COS42_06505 [Flavobacteriales bacterium CG03_land_8_20_14_0_80_35_15]|nr:hypothetical protein [Zetaproteobacteria bacterium]OIO08709.1 MAG: hypothetical protein AUJ53_11160 [Flavobacteriaceae bacterium CG1_02_35_72]PIV17110.1 MAG: hypothetical protein COS42_06505 [Flavobacteriales bacterium CG03_land_8_20_14_0_80_35_15]PIX05833.1 MAG: hypothetical protein COZ76_12080 [Flavobacteriales bacterium CG_4_8_14_3_um_filter_35_10]PJA05756.1 MAG: hypothetical protein COX71_05075 [Flavobacteriales bacterium CG_4_10_14_0_2_um_filter_35_18]